MKERLLRRIRKEDIKAALLYAAKTLSLEEVIQA
jgi:uncharacterized protein (DUF433 family)